MERSIITNLLTYLFPLDFWGNFMNGVKLMLATLIGGIFEIGMVIAFFGILLESSLSQCLARELSVSILDDNPAVVIP